VIHLGPSNNLESSVQQSGRCGRDGQQSNAIIYYLGRMLTHVDKSLKEYVCLHADGIAYRREYLLNYFDISKDEMKVALFTT
jgi:superfamily II DNA helicase RecQ